MAILKNFWFSLSLSGAVISEGSRSSSEGPLYSCLGSLWTSCPQAGSAKPVMQHQPLKFPINTVPFAELPNTQVLPDLASFQQVCQLLGSEHSLDHWEFLYAWIETAAVWLMQRQNPAPHFPVGNAVAAPCTCPIWAGRRAMREACLSWVGPESASSRLEETVKAAVVFQIYIYIMGCSCFTCFSKTYATKWAVCVDFNYTHWLLLA